MASAVSKNESPEPRFMTWVRVAMSAGLIVLLAALVVGKATQGGPVAQVLGIGGGGLLVAGAMSAIVHGIITKARRKKASVGA